MWDTDIETAETNTLGKKMAELDAKAQKDALDKKEEAEERRKKNHDFVQFNRGGLDALSKITNPIALRAFLFLTKEMNRENKIIVSQQTLAERLGVSRQSISTAVKELVNNKMFTILKSGSSSIYCLNADVVWSDAGNKKQYASFRATVLVSKKEQSPALKRTTVKRLDTK